MADNFICENNTVLPFAALGRLKVFGKWMLEMPRLANTQ
jgi:hypothetical protein